jgi:biotin carboxyl carrier protein
MKMFAVLIAPAAGVIQSIEAAEGDVVEAKDLLMALH